MALSAPVVLIGVGEMGGVFGRAFLRLGHAVQPILRGQSMADVAAQIAEPVLAVVAVGEADLHATLDEIPDSWRNSLVLLQNELLPHDWQRHGLEQPTVISVWFEKKPGQDYKVIVPSPVYGPKAGLVDDALGTLAIACRVLDNEAELLFELVRKNLYILTTNIAGLVTGGTVANLWKNHRPLAMDVANDVLSLQNWLTGQECDREALIEAMIAAFDGDPEHRCMGRSAPDRLANALRLATEAGLDVPALRAIAGETQAQ